MRYSTRSLTRSVVVLSSCAALVATLIVPTAAGAWTSYYRGGYGYGSSNTRYLQRQAQSEAAETRREAQRQKNREEIEKKKEAYQEEYLASQAAIRQQNQAASRAPRDAFFRKPGFTTTSLPGAAVDVKVADTTYHYFSGIFYRRLPNNYVVVPAPVGAVVEAVPEQLAAAVYEGDADTYAFYFGTFFKREGDKFKVVSPPVGTLVGYVPAGYSETEVEETVHYTFGGITYEPAFLENNVIYRVIKTG